MSYKKNHSVLTPIKIIISSLLIGSLFFISCEDDPEDNNQQDKVSAEAGNNISKNLGDTVFLDGSGSSGPNLVYAWSFSSKPSGSSALLYEATTATPYFIPDQSGSYALSLTVTSGNESDSDDVTVTITQGNINTKEVSGEINTNTTWTDHISDPSVPDYLITGHVYVNAELTINPGVLIHVKEDQGLYVYSEGTIISEGASGNEVVFTSENEAGGIHWRGILVKSNSSLNKLEHTKVRYAGNSEFGFSGTDYATAIGIEDGKLSILNSKVCNSSSYGLFLHSGEINQFSQNRFSNNMKYSILINASQAGKLDSATTFDDPSNAVEIYSSTLDETSQTNWPDLNGNARYYISGKTYVNSYLSISPGAIFDFAEDKFIKVQSTGVFVADASEGDKIVFTSKRAATGVYWKGLWIQSNDSRNIIANAEISYAGNTEWNFAGDNDPGAIGLEDGKLSLSNTTISNSNTHGFYLHAGSFTHFQSNTFENNTGHAIVIPVNEVQEIDAATTFSNNGFDGVTVYSSTMSDQGEWVDLNGSAKYKFEGWVYIEAGLTIKPGAELVFDEDKAIVVQNTGYIIAKGNAGNEITFTSSNEPGNIRWAGIWIKTSDARNELDYVIVNLAGGYEFNYQGTNYTTAIAGDDDDNPYLTLTNSTVKNSGSYAVYWEGGTINSIVSLAANNTFINNGISPDVYTP